MKATKYLAMAAAALAFAACSNDELASVGQQPAANGMKPVEFTTAVSNQTRAQIMGESDLNTYWVQTTGTFYKADGDPIVNPKLTLEKVGGEWTYKVNNDAEASMLYWPMEDYSSTFAAWYYEDGGVQGTFDNSTAQKDAIGAYATHTRNDEGNTVGLDFKHAVSKAVFQTRLLGSENNLKVKIDIKEVALHNVAHAATAYTAPTAETTMGAFTLSDGKRDLVAATASNVRVSEPTGDAGSVTADLGTPMLVLPQNFTAQDLTADTWTAPYISVLARISSTSGSAIYPKNAGENDYAWVALPLPADFTGFQAHHKYIFTLNFRSDALGKVDRDQTPDDGTDTEAKVDEEDKGTDITPAHSGFELGVTVEEVLDFDVDGEYELNQPFTILSTLTGDFVAEDGCVLTGTLDGSTQPYKISIADGATVRLNGVTINGANDEDYNWAGITCEGDATIILMDGTENTVKGFHDHYPGIFVPSGKTLTIVGEAEGTGSLFAGAFDGGTPRSYAAGIGGAWATACGNITILGGIITAQGGQGGTGIGGATNGGCGDITISGGTVTATGGSNSSGIGSAEQYNGDSYCGNITITGGTVTATPGYDGAGIGTGDGARCGDITITNGVTRVTSTKGNSANYSIGPGSNGTCGTVTIGGIVYEGGITESPFTYEP